MALVLRHAIQQPPSQPDCRIAPDRRPSAVAAGALDPEPVNPAQFLRPCLQLGVAAAPVSTFTARSPKRVAVLVDRYRDTEVLVSVDPTITLCSPGWVSGEQEREASQEWPRPSLPRSSMPWAGPASPAGYP